MALEFETRRHYDDGPGYIDAAFLKEPVDLEEIREVIVDDERLPLNENVITTLVQTVRAMEKHRLNGKRVDCAGFAIMLCGGTYNGFDHSSYRNCQMRQEIRMRTVERVGGIESLPVMRPVLIGTMSPMWPKHAVVRIDEDVDKVIQVFGDTPPALSGYRDAVAYYGASFQAPVDHLSYRADGRIIMDYKAPDAAEKPAHIYRSGD